METILILGSLIGLLLLRVPVAFAMGALGTILLWLKGLPLIGIPQRLFGTRSMPSLEMSRKTSVHMCFGVCVCVHAGA